MMMGTENSEKKFEELIENNSLSAKEISELMDIYKRIDELDVPLPSEKMQSTFYDQLELYKLKRTRRPGLHFSWPDLNEFFGLRSFALQPAFGIILFFNRQ